MAPTICTTEPLPGPRPLWSGAYSEDAHPRTPGILIGRRFRVDNNVVGEGVRIGRGDGWDMVFVAIDNVDDLVCSFLEGLCHGSPNLDDVYTKLLVSFRIFHHWTLRSEL